MNIYILDVANWDLGAIYAKWFSETVRRYVCVLSPAHATVFENELAIDLNSTGFDSFIARQLILSAKGDKWLAFTLRDMSADPDDEDSLLWELEGLGVQITHEVSKLEWRDFDSTAAHPTIWTMEDAWSFWNGDPKRPWETIEWSALRDDLSHILAAGRQYANKPMSRAECLLELAARLVDKPMRPGPYLLELDGLKATLPEPQASAVSKGLEQLFGIPE